MAERELARARAEEQAVTTESERPREQPRGETAEAAAETAPAPARVSDGERAAATESATVGAREAVSARDRLVGAAKKAGKGALGAAKATGKAAGKAVSFSGGWLGNEMVSDWNRTALGFGERMRRITNVAGRIFNPFIRMGAAMEDWAKGYPPFSWFMKKTDTTEALEDLLPDYGKGDGKKK
ncbi:hypothetical protein A3C17_03030 [Candidatus Uhrbacteria bacterium RIFCSPHIGHO2_02_FULL_53_13]|uniref:Uncharacterized protein n=1 Tax=Candidatus Uhrbacteria bacterium RIFCSPHIGHO2_02_FULL_53_13 TaxID=1802389 RepID=A0A1F7U0I5_9BACT|nr:MAG: hypothetical protein A3C17_03030 [Candidatus Uhrbacteria bacterium RIFCSPHIGHO2_02_FULL_53_13]